MITITRFDHIAQAVPEIEPQAALLQGLFGFGRGALRENAAGGFRELALTIPGSTVAWKLLEPLGADSPIQQFLDTRRPGLHHVAVQVPDLAAAEGELRAAGTTPRHGRNGAIDAYMNPEGRDGLAFRFLGPDGSAGDGANPVGRAGTDTLGIVGIDHICQAYRDRDLLARWYENLLGLREIWRTPDGEHDDLADLVMETPGGQLFWEIIMPVGEGSFIERFVETRGPSAHHVTFQVEDWPAAMAACEAHEIPTFDPNEGETGGARWQDAFIHPRYTGGILVQLFWEEKPGVWVRSDKVPSGR